MSRNEQDLDPTRPVADDPADNPAGTSSDSSKPVTSRRPTPAATAASRARRIGGVRPAADDSADASADATADDSTDEPAAATGESEAARPKPRVSTAKAAARPTTKSATKPVAGRNGATAGSARALKAEAAQGKDADHVVTQVPGWLRWLPAAVLVAAAIVAAVFVATGSHGVWWAQPSSASERDQVLAAAKRCTSLANTYNYKTIAADEARGKACTTGEWANQYASAMDRIVKPAAAKLKAAQSVQINTAGIESTSDHGAQWTVILFGQTTITQSGQATPRNDPFSAVVRMNRVHGKYLVGKIDLITTPSSNS